MKKIKILFCLPVLLFIFLLGSCFEGKKYTGITTEENRKVFLDFINDNYWSLHKESILSAEYIGDFSYEYVKTTDDIFGPDFFNVY